MFNKLEDVKRRLKYLSKKSKFVKYSVGLAVVYSMLGATAFADDLSDLLSRHEILKRAETLQAKLDKIKKANASDLDATRLELVELMEQGDHIVKSPWESWQFGFNFMSSKMLGDVSTKKYQGKLIRDPWWISHLNPNSERYKEYLEKHPVSPDVDPSKSATTSTRKELGEEDYGVTELSYPKEKPTSTVINVSVKDREVEPIQISFTKPEASVDVELKIPSIEVPTFSPKAPEIVIPASPVVPVISTPGAGGGNSGYRGFWFSSVPVSKMSETEKKYKDTKAEYDKKFKEVQAKKEEYIDEYKKANPQGTTPEKDWEDAALEYARSKPDYQQMVADIKKYNQEEVVPITLTAENLRREPSGHSILSEIDIKTGTIEGTFTDNQTLEFTADNLKIQTGNNGQASLYSSSVQKNSPPFSGPFFSELVKGANDRFEDGRVKLYGKTDQAIIKHVDIAVGRYAAGTKIIATNNIQSPNYGKQILHYDEHYDDSKKYNLKQLVDNKIITEDDKKEWTKYLNLYGIDYNHKVDNRNFQMVENAGDWYLRGHKIMAVNLQAHSGSYTKNSIFRNVGTITGLNEASKDGYLGEHVGFMFTEGWSTGHHRGFDNVGKIEMRAPKSVLFHYHTRTGTKSNGVDLMMNSGSVKMYGSENVGFIAKKDNSYFTTSSALMFNKPVTLLGDSNIGAVINKDMFFNKFNLKFDIGTEDPLQDAKDEKGKDGLLNSGNIAGNSDKLSENSIGLYLKKDNSLNSSDLKTVYDNYNNIIGRAKSSLSALTGNNTADSINMETEKYYNDLIEEYTAKINNYKPFYDEINKINSEYSKKVSDYRAQYQADNKTQYDQIEAEKTQIEGEIKTLTAEIEQLDTEMTALKDEMDQMEQDNPSGYTTDPTYTAKKTAYDQKEADKTQKEQQKTQKETDKTANAKKKSDLDAPMNTQISKINSEKNTKVNEQNNLAVAKFEEVGLEANIKDLQINLGKFSKKGTGINVEDAKLAIGDLKADHTATVKNFIKHSGDLNGEEVNTTGNILAFVGDKGELKTSFDTELTAENSKDVTAILVNKGTKVENKAKISMENVKDSKGIIIAEHTTPVEFDNYNDIIIKGDNGIAIANFGGKFRQLEKASGERTKIEVEGAKGIAVYNKGAQPLEIHSADIKIDKGATGLFAEGDQTTPAEIKLKDTTLTVGADGLLFYNYSGTSPNPVGKFTLLSDTNVTVEKDGVLFYNRGTVASIPTFLDMLVGDSGNKKLNVTIKDGARVFVLDDPNTELRLSSLPSSTSASTLKNGNQNVDLVFNIEQGARYKYYTANGGKLYVDLPVNLDQETDAYFQNDIMSASVEVEKPMTNNGKDIAKGLKYAVAQKNSDKNNLNRVQINVKNTITLTEKEGLMGVVAESGKITNDSTISTTGDKNIAIVGSAGTEITNNKDVIIGKDGVGILGTNQLSKDSEIDNFKITHAAKATIKYDGDKKGKAYGIVARNNYKTTDTYASTVELGKDSVIDFDGVSEAIGVLAQGSHLTITDNGANITVGEKGRGYLIENTTTTPADEIAVTLNAGKIIAKGDEAIGVYTNGSSVLTSGKEVEISGKKSIGYYAENGINLQSGAKLTIGESVGANDEKTVGVYTTGNSEVASTVQVGDKSVGIYKAADANATTTLGIKPTAVFEIGKQAVGIYTEKTKLTLDTGSQIKVNGEKGVGIYASKGSEIDDKATFTIAENSHGFILDNSTYTGDSSRTVSLDGNDSMFIYAKNNSTLTGIPTLNGKGDKLVGVYSENSTVTADKDIDFSAGKGNVGIYAKGGTVNYTGNIKIGESIISEDPNDYYTSIGITALNGANVTVNNGSTITVKGNGSMGLYAAGAGTVLTNNANISLEADTNKYTGRMIGIYAKDGAKVVNNGDISTAANYAGNKNVEGIIGIGIDNGELENHGNITIQADGSHGIFLKKAVIKNYGTIKVEGKKTYGVTFDGETTGTDGNKIADDGSNLHGTDNGKTGSVTASNGAKEILKNVFDPSKTLTDIEFTKDENGEIVINRGGEKVKEEIVVPNMTEDNVWTSEVGIYLDTLGRTKPIEGDGFDPSIINDLIIGTEAAELTNAKNIRVKGENLGEFKDFIETNAPDLNIYSGSLTWTATYDDAKKDVVMAKLDYKDFSKPNSREYNFLDGLEQRYGANALDSREKQVFNKLNDIGKNEGILFTQATDEMLGNQYATIAQRTNATVNIIDDEILYLRDEWDTESKDSNKIKIFGTAGKYETNAPGIKDWKNNAFGIAYLHEKEGVTLGNSKGWYAGLVNNNFYFQDIGKSTEKSLQAKLGIFKSKSFDDNNYLNWNIAGDVFVGVNKMDRKYLVVDDIFNAKSNNYLTYGASIKNELTKTIRVNENWRAKAYGRLDVEYGRHGNIKEELGEVRLDVESKGYFSVKPELGVMAVYNKQFHNGLEFEAKAKAAYTNELGILNSAQERAKVAYTTADYYNLNKDKENRTGTVKLDLNVDLNNRAWGLTGNVGYDVREKNLRFGAGLRVIY